MKKNYRHLSAEERAVIMIEYGKGTSVCAAARAQRIDGFARTCA
jgi:hypothetical protein